MCNDVMKIQAYEFKIDLIQAGRGYEVKWSSSNPEGPLRHYPAQLRDGKLRLRFRGEEKASHTPTARPGEKKDFFDQWGGGYVLAYTGDAFGTGKTTDFAVTARTSGSGGTVTNPKKRYNYTVWLGMNQSGYARVAWRTDLGVRPKQCRIRIFHKDDSVFEHWVERREGSVDTQLRWGVDLSAVLTGEDSSNTERDLVRTDRTSRS